MKQNTAELGDFMYELIQKTVKKSAIKKNVIQSKKEGKKGMVSNCTMGAAAYEVNKVKNNSSIIQKMHCVNDLGEYLANHIKSLAQINNGIFEFKKTDPQAMITLEDIKAGVDSKYKRLLDEATVNKVIFLSDAQLTYWSSREEVLQTIVSAIEEHMSAAVNGSSPAAVPDAKKETNITE